MDAIFKRRSIRKYKNEEVSDEKIHKIIQAGMSAPNAFATNEWEFIVIRSAEGHKKLEQSQKWAKSSHNASAVILVCGDTTKETNEKLLVQNCSAAVENMLIEATYLDLGSLWLEASGSDEFVDNLRREFNIPKHILPIAIVAIGVADQEREPHDKFYEENVHHEVFK